MYHNNGFLNIEACITLVLLASMSLIVTRYQVGISKLKNQMRFDIQIVDLIKKQLNGTTAIEDESLRCIADRLSFEQGSLVLAELPVQEPLTIIQVKVKTETSQSDGYAENPCMFISSRCT